MARLSTLHYRALPYQTLSAQTPAALFTALDAAFTSGTDANGNARTPGSGSAHTVVTDGAKYIYGTAPNSGAGGLKHYRWIIACSAGAETPKMETTLRAETFLASKVMASIYVSDDSPSFGTWDHATSPFTGTNGRFWGYVSSVVLGSIHGVQCYESEDNVVIDLIDNSANVYPIDLGLRGIDPESTNTLVVESATDNSISFIATSGTDPITSTWVETYPTAGVLTTDSFYSFDNTVNADAYCGAWIAGTKKAVMRRYGPSSPATTQIMKLPSGEYRDVEIELGAHAAAPNDFTYGRLREKCYWISDRVGTFYTSSGTLDRLVYLSPKNNADGSSAILKC